MFRHTDRSRPTREYDSGECKSTEYWLSNSRLRVESGPAGLIVRIERFGREGYRREWAGPVPEETVEAIRKVALFSGGEA